MFSFILKYLNCNELLTLLGVIISFITLIMAIRIPRKIMLDQQFASLTEQYRSTEMGFAIHSLFHFYEKDCENNPDNIKERYKDRFHAEVRTPLESNDKNIDPVKTLHFQRRLIAYFYWDLARLYFESRFPKLTKKQLLKMVGENERQLISLVLHMSEANKECFAKYDNLIEPKDDEVPMNIDLKCLYEETDDLV